MKHKCKCEEKAAKVEICKCGVPYGFDSTTEFSRSFESGHCTFGIKFDGDIWLSAYAGLACSGYFKCDVKMAREIRDGLTALLRVLEEA